MTTTVAFQPSSTSNFQFNCTLDGNVYTAVLTWNFFGCRYYINLYDQSGNRIFTLPLIGSPLGYDIESITWANNIATVTLLTPHTYTVGSVVPLLIAGNTPDAFNGTFDCAITSNTTFTFALPTVVVDATVVGTATYNLSLTAGYFNSTLVYLPDNEQFVINP